MKLRPFAFSFPVIENCFAQIEIYVLLVWSARPLWDARVELGNNC